MSTLAAPMTSGERIETLDAIRGFALLGIFIMNMPYFNASMFAGADGSHEWPQWWDRSAEIFRDVVFSGKFNSMFSMLFAIGFTIQLERLRERDPRHATATYLRRTFWLLIFGVIHACVFWTGDILHMYALFGFLLFALSRLSDRAIIFAMIACLLFPTAAGIYRMTTTSPEKVEEFVNLTQAWASADNIAFGHGGFIQIIRQNTLTMIELYTDKLFLLGMLGSYVQILTTMLLGLLLGRRRFFQNAAAHLGLVRRVQWWALAIGVACGVIFGTQQAVVDNPAEPTVWSTIAGMCYVLCRVAMMIFYVSVIIRAIHNDRWRQRLAPITLAGRMPLTNYLLQTLLATFLFYNWGLGLWGSMGPALDLVLAVGIFFVIQVPLTRFWLSRFRLGPMEYLWRLLTYGRGAMRGVAVAEGEMRPV